jgi:hypothetical protein
MAFCELIRGFQLLCITVVQVILTEIGGVRITVRQACDFQRATDVGFGSPQQRRKDQQKPVHSVRTHQTGVCHTALEVLAT